MNTNPDPYNWPFPKKNETMNLSTITNLDFKSSSKFQRESSFQVKDIPGTTPKQLIHKEINKANYGLSTFIEPRNTGFKTFEKVSDALKVDDIKGTRPQAVNFTTTRVVNPLSPVYKLPSTGEITTEPARKFIKDTLNVNDFIEKKSHCFTRTRGVEILNQQIEGTKPLPRTHTTGSISTLKVEDINKDGVFKTNRNVNPLNPTYVWRDESEKLKINKSYGKIEGNSFKEKHPLVVNKQNNLCLGIQDIEGAAHNSCFQKRHFLQKRRAFRNYLKTDDIEKAQSSTLKKGITSCRSTNPLVPRYQYPGNKQLVK